MDLCIICGRQVKLWKKKKWIKLSWKQKLKFWNRVYLGFCFSCWVKALIQIYKLTPNKKERYRIYGMLCEE